MTDQSIREAVEHKFNVIKICKICNAIYTAHSNFQKHCSECIKTKERRRYYKDIQYSRQKNARLKREWRKRNPEKAKEIDKQKHKRYRNRRNAYSRKYYAIHKEDTKFVKVNSKRSLKYYHKNKEKALCRNKLRKAVYIGKISKALQCSICGSKKNIQAHHKDYSKPFEVLWVCKKCHYAIHSEITKESR